MLENLRNFLKEKGLPSIEVEEVKAPLGVFMYVNPGTQIIYVDLCNLRDSYSTGKYKISFLDFCTIVMCHEIGHIKDVNLEEPSIGDIGELTVKADIMDAIVRVTVLSLKQESAAFRNGMAYVDDRLKEEYIAFNEKNFERKLDLAGRLASVFKFTEEEIRELLDILLKEIRQ